MTHTPTSYQKTLNLSGGCKRHLLPRSVWWFRLSSLLARYTDESVFSILNASPGIFWGRIKQKVPPKTDGMKHGTTRDHDGRSIPEPSGGCQWCLLPRGVQQLRRSSLLSRYEYVIVFSTVMISAEQHVDLRAYSTYICMKRSWMQMKVTGTPSSTAIGLVCAKFMPRRQPPGRSS